VDKSVHARRLGAVGIWSSGLSRSDPHVTVRGAVELEQLGFKALWLPGGLDSGVMDLVGRVLAGTTHIVVTTAIVSVWAIDAEALAARHATLRAEYGDRFVLGLGVSHAPLVALSGRTYSRPLATMREYLDALDRSPVPMAQDERLLAAQGPRMLELARDRSLGAHPFIVTPEHTRLARGVLGPSPLLAPGQKVLFEADPVRARAIARVSLGVYMTLPNYTDNLRRLGFSEQDLAGGGSDRLIDALVAWGDVGAVRARIGEHLAAGADHVAVEVLTAEGGLSERDGWLALAPTVIDPGADR
jgi:probable F420-dependent oxidoreductase